jgi:aminoglycoside phosphotransferase (APT) family kinase protein
VDLAALDGLLDQPHGYAGGARRRPVGRAVDALPDDARGDARRRLDDALALPAVPATFVHGDLGGHNMRWNDGRLVGVIDWDWAAGWDPAIDAACLAWHGWDAVAAAVDPPTYQRARIWHRTFGIEQLAVSWLRPPGPPDIIPRTAEWLRRTRGQPSTERKYQRPEPGPDQGTSAAERRASSRKGERRTAPREA